MKRGIRVIAVVVGLACLLAALGVWVGGLGGWRSATPMPLERTEVATAALSGKIYVVGGFKTFFIGGVTDAVQEYDPALDRWKDRAPLPEALHHVAAAGIDGKLYAVGGHRNVWPWQPVASLWRYDPSTDRWQAAKPMPTARHGLGEAAVGSKIYVIGGGVNPGASKSGFNEVFAPGP